MPALKPAKQPPACLVLAFAALLVTVGGCGRNRVTADIDIDSFLAPEDLTGQYDAPPVPGLITEVTPISINLVDGLSVVGPPEELEITTEVRYDNAVGEGTARFSLFLAESSEAVYNTVPVASLDADLLPQTTTTRSARFAADQRVLDLFQQEQMYVGLRFQWMPQNTASLQGDYTVTSINAHVASKIDIF